MEYCKGDQAEETEKKLADKKVKIVEEREVKRRMEEAERRSMMDPEFETEYTDGAVTAQR